MSFSKSIIDDNECINTHDRNSLESVFTINALEGLEPAAINKLVGELREYPQPLTNDMIKDLPESEAHKVISALEQNNVRASHHVREVLKTKDNKKTLISNILELNNEGDKCDNIQTVTDTILSITSSSQCSSDDIDSDTLSKTTKRTGSSASSTSSRQSGRSTKRQVAFVKEKSTTKQPKHESYKLPENPIDTLYKKDLEDIMYSNTYDRTRNAKERIERSRKIQYILKLAPKFKFSKNGVDIIKTSDLDSFHDEDIEEIYIYLRDLASKHKHSMQMFMLIQLVFTSLESLAEKSTIFKLEGLTENLNNMDIVEKERDTLDLIHKQLFGNIGRSENPFINLSFVLLQPIGMTLLHNHINGSKSTTDKKLNHRK